ncbi:coiled-coil alpha-helical rod protein 1 [Syngnathoides biaculeatus]|uniref:coiled-coil alpha-helical rod protein 1 n=1 Tax=Syngnathoides biaculeatus TaxID=300417 RepID=UPI002ADE07C7|nr:coiled-coil alpha-helical rod protein 1 [Syngnathoides biaculeatus]
MDSRPKLNTPTDFVARSAQDDLVPPSRFASSPPKDPWLGFAQPQGEISTQRTSGRTPDARTRSSERGHRSPGREEEWRLEAAEREAEAERLKEQMEALRDAAHAYRDEIRVKNQTISRQRRDLETMRREAGECSRLNEELVRCRAQTEKLSSELERFRNDAGEEIAEMMSDGEAPELARELAPKARASPRLAEEAENFSLRKQQAEQLQRSNAELSAVRKSNDDLQSQVQSVTRQRDELKELLSQLEDAYETQSANLRSLRNYIGRVAADEKGNEAFERLNKEKAALQKSAQLLTVRLHSMSEIVSLQEEKILKQVSTEPLVTGRCDGLLALPVWREKVFKLCVQLRLKDVELRDASAKHLQEVGLLERELQEERRRATVLQHSLDARIAELDQEKAEKGTLEQDLARACAESRQLEAKSRGLEAELKSTTEALHGFSAAFDRKIAEVDAARARLATFGQRLNFARGRVETVRALVMRRFALQKVRTASQPAERAAESIKNLQMELTLVCQERSKLAQELKRSPELIDKALAAVKEEHENELERCRAEAQKAVSGAEEVRRSLRGVLARLEASEVTQEELRSELLSQKERSRQAPQKQEREMESRCAEKLREMEIRVATAEREHTKAVQTLRQLERALAGKHRRETEALQSEHTKKELQRQQTQEAETNPDRLMAAVPARAPRGDSPRQNDPVPGERGEKAADRIRSTGAKPPAEERILSVLEELHILSAAVLNGSEDSAEDEEEPGGWSRHS